MRCLVCQRQLPPEGWQCPNCGDHVGQWMEMNALASQFHADGTVYAANGLTLRAALCLTKAAVLNPADPAILVSLGKFLAQCGDYEYASYYLSKAISTAETQALPVPEDAITALKKLEQLQAAPTMPVTSLLKLIPFRRKDDRQTLPSDSQKGSESPPELVQASPTESATGTAEAWSLVTDVECSYQAATAVVAAVFAWPQPPVDHHRGPWLYLRGVIALAAGDLAVAERLFRESTESDDTHRNAELYLLHLAQIQGDVRSVIAFLQQQRSGDDIAETLAIAAKIQESRGNIEGAALFLQTAVELATCEDRKAVFQERHSGLQIILNPREPSLPASNQASELVSLEADDAKNATPSQSACDAPAESSAS